MLDRDLSHHKFENFYYFIPILPFKFSALQYTIRKVGLIDGLNVQSLQKKKKNGAKYVQ